MFFACAFQSADEFICASLFVPLGIMNTAPTLKMQREFYGTVLMLKLKCKSVGKNSDCFANTKKDKGVKL